MVKIIHGDTPLNGNTPWLFQNKPHGSKGLHRFWATEAKAGANGWSFPEVWDVPELIPAEDLDCVLSKTGQYPLALIELYIPLLNIHCSFIKK